MKAKVTLVGDVQLSSCSEHEDTAALLITADWEFSELPEEVPEFVVKEGKYYLYGWEYSELKALSQEYGVGFRL